MNWSQPKIYAVKHKDEEIRAASRSGGIFTALSDLVLDDGGKSFVRCHGWLGHLGDRERRTEVDHRVYRERDHDGAV